MSWETVIGLEIHAQLSTKSKLFSGGSTEFGAESNTHVDLIDMGLPGVLPVANKEAFFKDRVVETGFRKAFKGDWGSEAHTKKPGVVQDLNRLSFFGFICQLRKTNLK